MKISSFTVYQASPVMYRVVVLAVVCAIVSADLDTYRKKCHRLGQPMTLRCCKDETVFPNLMNVADIKECLDMPVEGPDSCEHYTCIGKKRGYLSDDGKFDKEVFEKVFNEDFKNAPSLVESVKEKCINGDLATYSLPDLCEMGKLKHCVQMQAVTTCKEWVDGGSCAGVKDLVKECAKLAP